MNMPIAIQVSRVVSSNSGSSDSVDLLNLFLSLRLLANEEILLGVIPCHCLQLKVELGTMDLKRVANMSKTQKLMPELQ